MFYDVGEMNTIIEKEDKLRKITLLEAIKKGEPLTSGFNESVRSRTFAWIESDTGQRFLKYEFQALWEFLIGRGESCILRYRNVGEKKLGYIYACIDSFMKHEEYDQTEYYKKLQERIFEWSLRNINRNKVMEVESYDELKKFLRHFSSSDDREKFFKRLLELATTQEEIFFVVAGSKHYTFWPDAVRRLASLKDLSPLKRKS